MRPPPPTESKEPTEATVKTLVQEYIKLLEETVNQEHKPDCIGKYLTLKLIESIKNDIKNIDPTVIHIIFSAGKYYQSQQINKPTTENKKTDFCGGIKS